MLKIPESASMETRLRAMASVAFKTLNDLNSNFMKPIFYGSRNLTHRKSSLYFILEKQHCLEAKA